MKKIIKIYVRFVQKILVTILLTIVYFTVLGITKIFVFFFPGKFGRRCNTQDTFWLAAEDYNSDMQSALEQS